MEKRKEINKPKKNFKLFNIMNKNSMIKILAIIAIGTFLTAIYFSNQQAEQKRELEKAKDSLNAQNKELELLRNQISIYNDSLSTLLNQLSQTVEFSENTKSLVRRADNSKYLINLHSLNPEAEIKKKIISNLNRNGFSVVDGIDLKERTSWISSNSSVLFYSPKSEEKANEIAEILSNTTGKKFLVNKGVGLGVRKGEENWTFFIHYVN